MNKKYAVLCMKDPFYTGQVTGKNYNGIKLKVMQGFSKEHITDALVNGSDWNPGPNEKVYFFPGCAVPRFKVREKFKVTIKPKYATAAFVPSTGLRESENMFDVNEMISMPAELVTRWLEMMYGESHWFVVKFKSVYLNCEEPVLFYRSEYERIIRAENEDPKALIHPSLYQFGLKPQDYSPSYTGPQLQYMSYYIHKTDSYYYEVYTPAMDCELGDLKCPVYLQDEILKILNEDSVVIDENQYRQLRAMATSSDKQDLIMCMELMANANYEESFIYLLMLIQEFGHEMIQLKQSNHVNFKGMLEFFDLDIRKMKGGAVRIELLVATMKKLGKFTRTNVQRLTSIYGELVSTDNAFESRHFKKGPVLKREVEDELDDDIVSDHDEINLDQSMNL